MDNLKLTINHAFCELERGTVNPKLRVYLGAIKHLVSEYLGYH